MTDATTGIERVAAFEAAMKDALAALDHAAANATIAAWQSAFPSPARDRMIAAIAPGDVTIGGWDELLASLVKASASITAIGVNVSGHSEGPDPFFEVAMYDDRPFDFSTAPRDRIVAAGIDYPKPWMGRFVDDSVSLRVHGLDAVFAAIAGYEERYHQPHLQQLDLYADHLLLNWFLYWRIVQALERDLAASGLTRAMPVLVGEHDFGASFFTAIMSTSIANAEARAAPVLDAKQRDARARFDAEVESRLVGYRESRDLIREFGDRPTPSLKTHIDFCVAKEALEARYFAPGTTRPTWEMSDPEFAAFEQMYFYLWKTSTPAGRQLYPDPGPPPRPAPPPAPSPPTAPSLGGGLRRAIFGRKKS